MSRVTSGPKSQVRIHTRNRISFGADETVRSGNEYPHAASKLARSKEGGQDRSCAAHVAREVLLYCPPNRRANFAWGSRS